MADAKTFVTVCSSTPLLSLGIYRLAIVAYQVTESSSVNRTTPTLSSQTFLDLELPHPTTKMAERALNSLYKFAAVAGFGVFVGQQAIYDVKGGTRAVIFDRLSGVKDDVVNEGTHFLIPGLQRAITFDVRTKPRNISTTTGSKDLQMVSLTLRVLHRPEVRMLPKIYQVCSLHHRNSHNTPLQA